MFYNVHRVHQKNFKQQFFKHRLHQKRIRLLTIASSIRQKAPHDLIIL